MIIKRYCKEFTDKEYSTEKLLETLLILKLQTLIRFLPGPKCYQTEC